VADLAFVMSTVEWSLAAKGAVTVAVNAICVTRGDFVCVVGKGFWHWGKTPSGKAHRWRVCPCDKKHSEVLSFLALLLDRLPTIREGRRQATFSGYVECLRSDKMWDA
jgi:hypothetical protein